MKTKTPNIVPVLILTLITAITWIAFSIYRELTTKPAPVVPEAISEPLNPTLDKDALSKMDTKIFLDDSQIPVSIFSTSNSIIATPSPENTPTASVSAQTPTASPSGTFGTTLTP